MDAKELRIGNIVAHDDHSGYYFEVTGIEKDIQDGEVVYVVKTEGGSNGVWDNPEDCVNPIPIAESILCKCVFRKSRGSGDDYHLKVDDKYSFRITLKSLFERGSSSVAIYHTLNLPDGGQGLQTEIKEVPMLYLHQLQNVFYSVVGYELKVDLPIQKGA